MKRPACFPDLALALTSLAMAVATVASAQDAETFRSNTRLVDVEVVVHSKGKPVGELTVSSFAVFDEGKPQKIASFSVRRQSQAPPSQHLDGGEVSNRANAAGAEPASATVILLDTLNTDPEDSVEVRRQLLIYLDRLFSERRGIGDQIAVYTLNKTLGVIQDFTDDPERLRAILTQWKASSSVDVNAPLLIDDLPVSGDPLVDGMVQAAAKEMTDNAMLRRAETTEFALKQIARHLSGLPGRKKLIWAGASFSAITSEQRSRLGYQQIEMRDYSEYITRSVQALNQAQVAVYPIDPRGLCKPTCMSASPFTAPGVETMNLYAKGTGGRAFYAINDLAGAIDDAIQDSEVTYALGFYPDGAKLDGKFHKLQVKVSASGVEVRHRRGYLASDDSAPTPVQREKSLKDTMEAPLDTTEIGLSARWFASTISPGNHEAVVRIDMHGMNIATEKLKNGTMVWTSLVTISTFQPERPKPNSASHDLKLTFTQTRLAEVLKEGFLIRIPVERMEKKGTVRVGVQDRTTGRMGSLTLKIPS